MLWSEDRTVPITTALLGSVAALERLAVAATTSEEATAYRDAAIPLRARAAARNLDPQHHVRLRHIGTAENPFRVEELRALDRGIDHRAEKRARRQVVQDGDQVTPDAVAAEKSCDTVFQQEFSKQAKIWLLEALVEGEPEYHRLYNLGGPDLLLHALREAQEFQRLSAETKNA